MTRVSILAYAKLVLPVTIFTRSSGVKNEIITAGAQNAAVSKGATGCGGDCVAQRVGLICFFVSRKLPSCGVFGCMGADVIVFVKLCDR